MELPWNKIRLAALDLDGTTLRPDGTLSQGTKRAMERCRERGIEIVIASGRAYATLPDEVLAIRGIRYAITSNGAAVNEVPSGKRLWAKCIRADSVERILGAGEGEPAALETFIDGVPYAGEEYTRDPGRWGCPSASFGYVRSTRRPVPDIRRFILDNRGRLDSIDFICADPRVKRRLEEKLLAAVGGIYVTASVPHLLEISAAGGKGGALRTVCRLAGVRPEETAACGNADNDADMLLTAGIGAAVADATPACIRAADLVIGTNREDGVAAFLERLGGAG